ncbi:MAG: hypothetical protein JWM91_2761 [Rhodospirillales bacterium]|nr:hypothetical protein [Rhodospirillales bacterium]
MVVPDERSVTLNQARRLKMARSAHAYVRGSTEKFYEWLSTSAATVPHGPDIWICGDCHLGNLGPLADAKGRVEVQIRDLDQTVIGNPAHDLIRLGLTLASAARGSDLPGVVTARMIEALTGGYATALEGNFNGDAELDARPDDISALLDRATRRRWRHLARERLDTVEPKIPLGKRFWALARDESGALRDLFADDAVRTMIQKLQGLEQSDPVEIVDAAYWLKGCSSLGRLRYAVMLKVGEGKHAAVSLIDVKEATTAIAPRSDAVTSPRDNAVRIVTGAQALSPHLGNRMIAARLVGKAVVLRELMPQDLKIEAEELTERDAVQLAVYLGGIVGRAHGRQMDKDTRGGWRCQFVASSNAKLDAPSWLWSAVVELVAIHEAAYLDHCRRFALAAAA